MLVIIDTFPARREQRRGRFRFASVLQLIEQMD
jgi:hypothetical protein